VKPFGLRHRAHTCNRRFLSSFGYGE
jgi:hypothetical protein